MSQGGPQHVQLGEIVERISRPEKLKAGNAYRLLGVRWYAKGLFIKEPTDGARIKATRLFLVKEGDFIYNRLFAWKGSFAIAGPEHDGCLVSGEFPTFRIDGQRLLPTYLLAYFSNRWLWEFIAGQSSGTSQISRLRFKEVEFLRLSIPLPPLKEQKRIVSRLGAADDLRKLRAAADHCTAELIPALFHEMFGDPQEERWPLVRLSDILIETAQRNPTERPADEFQYIDISSVDNQLKTVVSTTRILGKNAPSRARKVVCHGDVIVSMVRPNLNTVALVPDYLDNQICSTGFSVLRPSSKTTSIYLFAFACSPFFISQLVAKTKGANYPAVGESAVRGVTVPLPPLSLQERFSDRVAEIHKIEVSQAASRQRLEALFQSMLHRAFNGAL